MLESGVQLLKPRLAELQDHIDRESPDSTLMHPQILKPQNWTQKWGSKALTLQGQQLESKGFSFQRQAQAPRTGRVQPIWLHSWVLAPATSACPKSLSAILQEVLLNV